MWIVVCVYVRVLFYCFSVASNKSTPNVWRRKKNIHVLCTDRPTDRPTKQQMNEHTYKNCIDESVFLLLLLLLLYFGHSLSLSELCELPFLFSLLLNCTQILTVTHSLSLSHSVSLPLFRHFIFGSLSHSHTVLITVIVYRSIRCSLSRSLFVYVFQVRFTIHFCFTMKCNYCVIVVVVYFRHDP